jgi:hypothetical protein
MHAPTRTLVLVLGLTIGLASGASAQTPQTAAPSDRHQQEELPPVQGDLGEPGPTAAKMLEAVEKARFKLVPAIDANTGLSIAATSRIARAFEIGRPSQPNHLNPWCAFAVFDAKAEWSTAEDATNYAQGSFSSTVAYCRPVRTVALARSTLALSANPNEKPETEPVKVPFALGLTAEIRARWGEFKEGQGAQEKTTKGNQEVFGGGLTLLLPTPPSWIEGLNLTAAYYTVIGSDGDLSVAEDLNADHVQGRLNTRLLPFIGSENETVKSIAIVVDSRASTKVSGSDQGLFEFFNSVGFEIGKGKTAATIRWEKGKEIGFKYDRKLVFGVILRILGVSE